MPRGRRRRPGHRGVRALVVTTVVLALTAAVAYYVSTSGPRGVETPAAQGGDQGEDAEMASTELSPGDLPAVPGLRQVQGAVADLRYEDCATGAGRQQVTGTVESTASRPRDFVITLNWITDSFDVVGRGVAVVESVEPGAVVTWEITADVAEGAAQCVPNVQRGALRD